MFEKLGCDFCHEGPGFTDSARGLLHDVGTMTALSGMRAGGPLFGFDTPTLLGVWETAPYLHDGSAPTLRDVLTTRNPSDLHGYVSSLSSRRSISSSPTCSRSTASCPCSDCRSICLPARTAGLHGEGAGGPIAGGCACELAVSGGGGESGLGAILFILGAIAVVTGRRARRRSGAGGRGARAAGDLVDRVSRRPARRFTAADKLGDAAGGERRGSGAGATRLAPGRLRQDMRPQPG